MNKIIKGSALADFVAAIAVMGVVSANMDQSQPKGNSALASVDLGEHLETTDHIVIGLVKPHWRHAGRQSSRRPLDTAWPPLEAAPIKAGRPYTHGMDTMV